MSNKRCFPWEYSSQENIALSNNKLIIPGLPPPQLIVIGWWPGNRANHSWAPPTAYCHWLVAWEQGYIIIPGLPPQLIVIGWWPGNRAINNG